MGILAIEFLDSTKTESHHPQPHLDHATSGRAGCLSSLEWPLEGVDRCGERKGADPGAQVCGVRPRLELSLVLFCTSLVTNDVEYLFMCSLATVTLLGWDGPVMFS